jgi:hypothetical protein
MAVKPKIHRKGVEVVGPGKDRKATTDGKTKSKQYRVYLAWEGTIDNPLEGMGYLIRPRHRDRLSVNLIDDEDMVLTATGSSMEFILVDDPEFDEDDIPRDSDEIFLKVVRRRLFGRDLIHAEPVGAPPKECVLSGRTGRVVWGGGDTVRDISPRPIPLRYWIKVAAEKRRQRTHKNRPK